MMFESYHSFCVHSLLNLTKAKSNFLVSFYLTFKSFASYHQLVRDIVYRSVSFPKHFVCFLHIYLYLLAGVGCPIP